MNNKLESLPEQQLLKLRKFKELNVRQCGLKGLPSSFGDLTELTKLDLNFNHKLERLPEQFPKLRKLKELYVHACGLKDLPPNFGDLTELTILSLSGNKELESLPEQQLSKLGKLQELNVAGCGLKELPPCFGDLTELTKLDLRQNNKLESLPGQQLSKLRKLKELYVSGCGLKGLPSSFGDLTELTKLDLCQNKELESLPEQFSKLGKLEKLYMYKCDLKRLPSSFGDLTELTVLVLSENEELESLPEQQLSKLRKLEELDVRGCGLKGLPSSFGDLTELTKLDLSFNTELKSLPGQQLSKLRKLKELNVSWCGLKGLPSSFGDLTELTKLDLRVNKELESLPEQFFKLRKLEELNLDGCGLKELSSNIGNLSRLSLLRLGDCSLTELPSSICNLDNMGVFRVSSNSLIIPPTDVCDQGFHAVRAYFSLLNQRTKLNRFKVILLGEACSGKTSLIETMIRQKPSCTREENRTIGVEEHDLKLSSDKTAKALDCGGQKCYQLSNQLFVSENSLILIVVDINVYTPASKASFHRHIGRYLQVVYERCRCNQVIIVFTQIDRLGIENQACSGLPAELCSYQTSVFSHLEILKSDRIIKRDRLIKSRRFADQERLDFLKCQNIKICDEVIFTSAKEQVGTVEKLKDLIDRLSQDRSFFPTVEHIIPNVWLDFEREVLTRCSREQLSMMERSKVVQLGLKTHNLIKEHVDVVLSYCHQVGTLLYFRRKRCLSDVVFGSCSVIMDVLKLVFCHSHDELEFQERYGDFYNSRQAFCADKEQLVEYGTVTLPLLKALLVSLNLTDQCFNLVVHLLLAFDFAYVKDDSKIFQRQPLGYRHAQQLLFETNLDKRNKLESKDIVSVLERDNARLLLPWLLNTKRPTCVTEKCPEHWLEVVVSYSFVSSLPMGLFQQFSARCHRHSHLIYHWESGFMLEYGPVTVQCTCQSEDDPWIHCCGRVPNSIKALGRLFHLLFRCLVDLEMLLKTVPGCLYEAFLEHKDGEETSQKHKIILSYDASAHEKTSHVWTLRAVDGRNANEVVSECSQAADAVGLSISKGQSLDNVFPNLLGNPVASEKLRKVAMNVKECVSEKCLLLACCLYVDYKGKAETVVDIKRMLDQWKKERGSGAVLAVLIDALKECNLDHVAKDLEPVFVQTDENSVHELQIPDILINREIMNAVRNFGRQSLILPFGRELLNKTSAEVENVICGRSDYFEQMYAIMEEWQRQEGSGATLKKLLDVCGHYTINIREGVVDKLQSAGLI